MKEKLSDKIKKLLKNKKNTNYLEEFEVVINDIDTFALYFKNREKKYVLIKDERYPFMLNEPDIEWIKMNKDNFDYYGEFYDMLLMCEKIQRLNDEEKLSKKTNEDYLREYLEHCIKDYSKLIEEMKLFKIDGEQYRQCLERINDNVKSEINNTLKKYENVSNELNSTRTYDEIMNNLMYEEVFEEKYPLYSEIEYEESISHCGYPDYMWQSGAEGTFIELDKIPNSKNSIFTYNKYIGGDSNEEYIKKMTIVSEEERNIIIKHWDNIQFNNESQFERDFMNQYSTEKAENLPKGWNWVIFNDASGHLESPTGKNYFSFDWCTYEYQLNKDSHYSYFGNTDDEGNELTFKDFQRYAENYALKKLVNLPENQIENEEDEEVV